MREGGGPGGVQDEATVKCTHLDEKGEGGEEVIRKRRRREDLFTRSGSENSGEAAYSS